jgi:thioredoxin-dependent peroxiredoxin
MIDPLKATKGRRMSKKTRKKTSEASARKATRGESVTAAKAAAKTTGKTTDKAAAKTSATKVRRATANPSSKAKKSAKRPKAAPLRAGQSGLSEGCKAPAFRLPRDGGQAVSLGDFSGQKLVLFFYPRADTPGCTKEAIDFTRLKSKFAESRTAVLGVSADPQKAQEAFRDRHQLSIPLVSDEQHEMLEAYGVWGKKSMYGKTFQGIFRTTVLIGADGRMIKIWRNVKVDGHADEVLAAARAAN